MASSRTIPRALPAPSMARHGETFPPSQPKEDELHGRDKKHLLCNQVIHYARLEVVKEPGLDGATRKLQMVVSDLFVSQVSTYYVETPKLPTIHHLPWRLPQRREHTPCRDRHC